MKSILLVALLLFQNPSPAQEVVNLTIPLPPPLAAVMHVDTVSLTTVSGGATTIPYTLTAAPIAAMGLIVHYNSTLLGGDIFLALPNVQPTLSITLPLYYTASDTITLVYWSAK